ncbi:MAG: Fpg/Nei family DNA glycosylase [Acidimicrobiia bacterium]|nr:Fpg/Nei family DNA glycosylase [Acidimicrobiia bacterium]
MPEGHSIHRYARLHRKHLRNGEPVTVASPQGRFADGAAVLDGRTVTDIDAIGKHLFYQWDGAETLHVHLGLFGKFKTHFGEPPPPTAGTRLTMATDRASIYLAGPTVCELIDPDEESAIRARLGPDPLDKRADGDRFLANLSRRRIPIGAALLDQKVISGIGNVYRSELLFQLGIPPQTPANQLASSDATALWDQAAAELRRGEKSGRIVTTDPAEFGAKSDRDLKRRERLYVYKRDGLACRRCGSSVRLGESANRKIWWCPDCQR